MKKHFTNPGFEVIDAHIHPFLEDFGVNIGRYGTPVSPDHFVEELKAVGTTRCCGSVIFRGKADMNIIRACNRAALRFRDRYPNFYVPGIHLHGGYPEESMAELDAMMAEGVRWVGELVPYIMDTGDYDTPGMLEVFGYCAKRGVVVNIHHGWPREKVDAVVSRFPDLKLVMAHPGELDIAKERLTYVAEHPNVYLDISGTGLFRWGMLQYAVELCGSSKILYGSDFPVCSAGMNLWGALAENLTDDQFQDIFSRNFLRLVGMNEKK